MSFLRISVVICAYSEARSNQLLSAIASVQNQAYPAFEIIVVVDHNPTLLGRVQGQFGQGVTIENREKRGLSRARNSGIARAQGDVVAFLDDDAVAAPDWLSRIAEKYDDPRVIGVGGSIEPRWQKKRPAWFPEEFDWVVGCSYRGMPQDEGNVRNLIGCNMSFRRSVFEQMGGFRNGFGQEGDSMLRCDETEFCIRVRQNDPDHTFLLAPRAFVFHDVPSERAQWSYFRTRCFTEGMAKAILSQLLGSRDGLSSERAYALSALPRGILRGLSDLIRRRDISGLARAGAIMAGLSLTAAGYLYGTLSRSSVRAAQASKDKDSQPRTTLQAPAASSAENGD